MAKPIAPDYGQQFLLPPALEDGVAPDHPARFLREFVEQLDLPVLGFATPAATQGRPPFAPSLLLKIWLYGYFQRIRSTRKLEAAWPSAKPCASKSRKAWRNWPPTGEPTTVPSNWKPGACKSFIVLMSVCQKAQPVWISFKAFKNLFQKFSARVVTLSQLKLKQETDTTGLAEQKQHCREEACAEDEGNLEVAAKVNYSYSDLIEGRDTATKDKCQTVHDVAAEIVDELEDVGVDEGCH